MERTLKKYIHRNTHTYTHVTKPLCCALETNTIPQINYTHTHTHTHKDYFYETGEEYILNF